ncbi:gastrula zinc finger protein XlCGF9.1-like [Onychostoma macrolepis]|uniref:gastrula zinc finger protein XlCGF9.1-like n=1 Tax=Onychostoma macrolepis TaxID=369639 RepID=UPI00272ACDCE|nr:gastrula zinc finger protein XlCGF9.1-like [Onychostoma macrolepis]
MGYGYEEACSSMSCSDECTTKAQDTEEQLSAGRTDFHSQWKPFVSHEKPYEEKPFHFLSHLRIHDEERPFACPQCGKSFRRKGNLLGHMRTHKRESPYSCPQCGKSFRQEGNLKRHPRIHSREKPFTCLSVNRRIHSGEEL